MLIILLKLEFQYLKSKQKKMNARAKIQNLINKTEAQWKEKLNL